MKDNRKVEDNHLPSASIRSDIRRVKAIMAKQMTKKSTENTVTILTIICLRFSDWLDRVSSASIARLHDMLMVLFMLLMLLLLWLFALTFIFRLSLLLVTTLGLTFSEVSKKRKNTRSYLTNIYKCNL